MVRSGDEDRILPLYEQWGISGIKFGFVQIGSQEWTNYSPITFLYWYDLPYVYKGETELDFWKHCPPVWDESTALDGDIGEYIVQARRSGTEWFVGAMNGLQPCDITINTADFLQHGKRYRMEVYNDDPSLNTRTKVSSTIMNIKAGKTLRLHLQASGGAALRFVLMDK